MDFPVLIEENEKKRWKTILLSDWGVETVADNIETAREDLKNFAKILGGNAVTNIEFSKDEIGEVEGKRKVKRYDLKGRVSFASKEEVDNATAQETLISINDKAERVKNALFKKTVRSRKTAFFCWIVLIGVIIWTWTLENNTALYATAPLLVLGLMFARGKNFDSWLNKVAK